MGPERAKTLDTCDLDPTATIATDSKSKKKKYKFLIIIVLNIFSLEIFFNLLY